MTRTTTALTLIALAVALPAAAQNRDREVYIRPNGGSPRGVRSAADEARPALGVVLAPARSRADSAGVRVAEVTDGSPAAKAGIEAGDRILSIDGVALKTEPADADDPMFADLASRRLQRELAKKTVGDDVSLVVQRAGATRTVRVGTVASREIAPPANAYAYDFGPGGALRLRDGAEARIFIDSVRTRLGRGGFGAPMGSFGDSDVVRRSDRAALGITIGTTGARRDTLGLFVSAVTSDGPAERAGIIEGARVASINGVDVRLSRADAEDAEAASLVARRFTRELDRAKAGDDVTLRVWQNGAYRTVTVKAAKASDVWKGDDFSFSFGDGGRAFVLPRVQPRTMTTPRLPMLTPPVTSRARAGVRS